MNPLILFFSVLVNLAAFGLYLLWRVASQAIVLIFPWATGLLGLFFYVWSFFGMIALTAVIVFLPIRLGIGLFRTLRKQSAT
jgi:hypothetical protein